MPPSDTGLTIVMCMIAGIVSVGELLHLLYNCRDYIHSIRDIAGWLLCIFSGPRPQKRTDAQQRRLDARLAEIRVENYLALLNVAMHVGGAVSTLFLMRFVLQLTYVSDPFIFIMLLLSYVPAQVLRVYPTMLNGSTLGMLHFWNHGLLFGYGAYLAFWYAPWFMHYYPGLLVLRTMLSSVYPVSLANNYWNFAWMVVAILAFSNQESTNAGIPTNNVISQEILTAVFFSYLVWKIELLQISHVDRDIEASWYLRAKATTERLLADMCDAVVELDHDLEIRKSCPKLADLLLKESCPAGAEKEPFANSIFSEEDCDRFGEFVARRAVPVEQDHNPDPNGYAPSMFLTLRDSIGTPVIVQVFHSCHDDPPDEICHIVGVREVESRSQANSARDTIGQVGRPGGHVDNLASAVVNVASVAAPGNRTDGAPVVLAPLIPQNRLGAAIAVVFNAFTHEIIAATLGFQSNTGPIPFKSSLGDIVVNYNDFCAWLHAEANGVSIDADAIKFEIKIAPAMAKKQPSFVFCADAYLLDAHREAKLSMFGVEAPHDAQEEEEQFDMLYVVVLGTPQAKWQSEDKKPNSLMRSYQVGPRPDAHSVAAPQPVEFSL